jgi:hypothetical protein
MTAEEIKQYLEQLNDELRLMEIKGEVSLYGGAVMCVVFDARPATKDVDAVFRPSSEIRRAIVQVARRNDLPDDWLNDGVKGYLVEHPQRVLFVRSNLTVFVPEADYLLAMKAISARVDTYDKEDVKTLAENLGLRTADEIFEIVEKYYPHQQIKPATQFFIEEMFGG